MVASSDTSTDASTMSGLLRQWADDDRVGLRFEDASWTWRAHVQAAADRTALLASLRRPGPFHVGVLLENVPEFVFVLGAASLGGAVLVGLNPTRRGDELRRDLAVTDCQLVITEPRLASLLADVDLPIDEDRVLDTGSTRWRDLVALHAGSPLPDTMPTPDDLLVLLFTSGTSGNPKAVRCSHRKMVRPGVAIRDSGGIRNDDVAYCAMPLFHSNGLQVAWAPAVAAGAELVLKRRFSASGFLPDVRRYGVTYFNYVGKPLTYVLAQAEQPDDADNPLRIAKGNEGSERDVQAFARRFDCIVDDGYGATEGGVYVVKDAGTPSSSIGRPMGRVAILDPETLEPCPTATFDEHGALTNAGAAIGELVGLDGAGMFEGYYGDAEAAAERLRGGMYWTGDLAYTDGDGYVYFAGRTADWLRVDGENLAAAPVERVLMRHPDVQLAAVYAVPDPAAGDQMMAALLLRDGTAFDAGAFGAFLRDQADLGTTWAPRFVRVSHAWPETETNKVLKRVLARERWECTDAVWWRPSKEPDYVPLTATDIATVRAQFADHGRVHALQT